MTRYTQIRRFALTTLLAGLTLGAAACGDDHDHDHDYGHDQEAPPDHACEHAQNGPFVPADGTALQAAATDSGDKPVIHAGEWSTVQLTDDDGDGAYEGFVTFEAREEAGHRFFTSDGWPGEDAETTDTPYIVVTNADGGADPIFVAKHPVGEEPGCVEVNFNHFYEGFEADTNYTVEISGQPAETISIVPVPEGAGGHDH